MNLHPLRYLLLNYEDNVRGLVARCGYGALTPEEKSHICNGAGPGGDGWWNKFLTWVIPNNFYGLSLKPVFDIHDHDYNTGGPWWQKPISDGVMLVNMLIVIWNAGKAKRWRRIVRAFAYYSAVTVGGKKSFNYVK